ncbi:MAG: AAA family ATPase [Candidatus Thiosymbion ectosymbiont of Robbea hypermnestra]|nr:AAA family ATPase [Candidatus Thiosymbion ectosymbiont of Robbea hypermnestra]
MLNSIQLTDFKNHADTTVRLGELTLLVGPNGAGKTGVLQGIQLVSQVDDESALAELGGREVLVRRGADCFVMELAGKDPRDSQRAWDLRFAMDRTPGALKDAVDFFIDGGLLIPELFALNERSAQLAKAREALGTAVYLRLDATRLSEPSYLESTDAGIDSDGYGLASIIAHLMTYERDRFERLESALRSIIPGVKRIRVRRIEKNKKVLADGLVLDMRSGDALPAHAVSEGTLIVLGLLAVLEGPDRPNLVLIDGIDHSLHPRAQVQLVEVLRSLIRLRPEGLQIVATSHSPYLIDALSPDEVWVVALRENGTAAAACLADHPDSEHFREVLGTGEFLSSVGEDWVLQQGATDAPGSDR